MDGDACIPFLAAEPCRMDEKQAKKSDAGAHPHDDDESRKDAIISADDTGMLSNERLITDGEIERGEHPDRR